MRAHAPAPTLIFATTVLFLFHDTSPLLWKLSFSGVCMWYIKRFRKKRKGKNIRTVKRARPFRRKRGDGSAICSAAKATLRAGHCGHLVGLCFFPAWPAPSRGHAACITSRLRASCLSWVTDHLCGPRASPSLPYTARIYLLKACTPLRPRTGEVSAGCCCAPKVEELGASGHQQPSSRSEELPTREAPSPIEISPPPSETASFVLRK